MISELLEKLEEAKKMTKLIVEKKSYTNDEMKALRTLLLQSVRNIIDPYLGHMPEKRHY